MRTKLVDPEALSGPDLTQFMSDGTLSEIFTISELTKIAYHASKNYSGDLAIGLQVEEGGIVWFRYRVEYISGKYVFLPTETSVPNDPSYSDIPNHYEYSFIWGLVGHQIENLKVH